MKRVLVTGSSTGFGRLLCGAFLERGWKVYATMRGAAGRLALFSEEQKRYPSALTILSLDVESAAEREAAAKEVEAAGGLDCLVNNAGFGQIGPCEEITEAEWRKQFEVNFFGALFLTNKLLPSLRESKGRVINISSILGLSALPLGAAYSSSKFALEGWSESLYHELRPHGVQVCVVEPGGFRTDFNRNLAVVPARPGSPYRGQLMAYERFRAKKMATGGSAPEKVARRVVKLAESRRMPLRALVGADAKAMDAVGRWLPRNWGTSLMSLVYSKVLRTDGA